jgi:hypothetical protein
MKKLKFRLLMLVAIAVIAVAGVSAQRTATSSTDKYMISAKAGGVNQIAGSVNIARVNDTSGLLLKGDQIEVGEKVSTGSDGRVEVLLNPGSYLRLGSNSAIEFKTTSLDDLQVKLDSGSAIFEVFATKEFTVSIFVPKGMVKIIESGVYRVDVGSDGSGIVAVTEGKAQVGGTTVKEGRIGTIDGNKVVTAKFDRDQRDELAEWSKTRSKVLASMTASLKNRDVRDSLLSSFNMGRWGMMDSFGLWVYNPFYRTYCFLPFGYGWSSPYGYGYGPGIWWYQLPPVIYNPPIQNPPIKVGGTRPPVTTATAPVKMAEPPYTKIDRVREPVRSIRNNPDFPADNSGPRSMPSSPPPVFMPAPMPDVRPASPTKKDGR